jgi:CelD/BcsL family acetyltransferase involved in cellulose biosynthesis
MAFLPSHARFSPGWIATLHMLEQAAGEPGGREVEFLGGCEEYKLAFADEQRPLHDAFSRPRTLAAHLYVGMHLGSVLLRRRLKRIDAVRRVYYDGFAPARRAAARLRRVSTTEA